MASWLELHRERSGASTHLSKGMCAGDLKSGNVLRWLETGMWWSCRICSRLIVVGGSSSRATKVIWSHMLKTKTDYERIQWKHLLEFISERAITKHYNLHSSSSKSRKLKKHQDSSTNPLQDHQPIQMTWYTIRLGMCQERRGGRKRKKRKKRNKNQYYSFCVVVALINTHNIITDRSI